VKEADYSWVPKSAHLRLTVEAISILTQQEHPVLLAELFLTMLVVWFVRALLMGPTPPHSQTETPTPPRLTFLVDKDRVSFGARLFLSTIPSPLSRTFSATLHRNTVCIAMVRLTKTFRMPLMRNRNRTGKL
jgi:hypothetical protein